MVAEAVIEGLREEALQLVVDTVRDKAPEYVRGWSPYDQICWVLTHADTTGVAIPDIAGKDLLARYNERRSS